MANYYVRSAAAGTADGSSWANAYTTLTAALSGKTNADTLWVADDHAETTTSAITLNCPTTPGLQILGVNTHVTEPPTALVSGAPTATVSIGAGSQAISIGGFAYVYGIAFQGGTAASNACVINLGVAGNPEGIIFDNCIFYLRAGSATYVNLGPAPSGTDDDEYVKIINSTFKFSAVGEFIRFGTSRAHLVNIAIDSSGSAPTTLFSGANASNCICLLEASDLTGKTWTNLVSQALTATVDFTVRDCKFPGSVSMTTGTHSGPGGLALKVHNCDSADTHIRFAQHSWSGSVVQQTGTLIRTGGATQADGTAYSMAVTGTANSEAWGFPLQCLEIALWNSTTGSSQTATLELLRDNATNLQNDEVWLELLYCGTSGVPLGTIGSSRMTDVFSTAADLSSSSVTWDTTGMSNPNKQKVSVNFTAQEAGYIIARVYVAKNTTLYLDPMITLS